MLFGVMVACKRNILSTLSLMSILLLEDRLPYCWVFQCLFWHANLLFFWSTISCGLSRSVMFCIPVFRSGSFMGRLNVHSGYVW